MQVVGQKKFLYEDRNCYQHKETGKCDYDDMFYPDLE